MNVLDLAHELHLSPKRSSLTNGGEYKSECPNCQEGKDRFCIWPKIGTSGRYWCRVCNAKGDGIQFCRDFLGMTFHRACEKLKVTPQLRDLSLKRPGKLSEFIPAKVPPVNQSWQESARRFISFSHAQLMKRREAIEYLVSRGLNMESIRRFSLGWNSENLFEDRERWGVPPMLKENGSPKRQWLPKGIVIPSFSANEPTKIKIRRSDWAEEDPLPKYVEISGSGQAASIYGDKSKPVIIVESELDAILIQQEAADLVCCVALGGVSKRPDADMHNWLLQAPLILLSLDFDEPGKKQYPFWMKLYSNLRPWPAPCSKSPGDAARLFNINLFEWINFGLFSI